MKRRKPIKQKSDKKRLREKIGTIHLALLKRQRGDMCEIHGRQCSNIGRMHILPVGKYPRLEFEDANVILAGWLCSHYWTHHDPDDKRAIYTKKRILELRACKTWDELRTEFILRDRLHDPITMFYLYCLHDYLEGKLNEKLKTNF